MKRDVQIMDIGMRSKGMEGAERTGLIAVGLLTLFLLLAMVIRLDNAAIVFSVVLPVLLLWGRSRWFIAGLTGGLTALWTYGFMGYFMSVIWPSPVLGNWLRGVF